MDEKLGLFVCPHGGGRWKFNTEKWNAPINSYSGWTRHTNTHISFGEKLVEKEDREFLSQYDYFILFSTTGRAANVVQILKAWFPNKPIVMMTDGYPGEFVEIRHPEPRIIAALEKVDLILGNRPDAHEFVTRLCDVPYFWLGFPIETKFVRQFIAADQPKNRVNIYQCWKAPSVMRMIQRHVMPTARFASYRSPCLKNDWQGQSWPKHFGIHLDAYPDTEWSEYLKVMGRGRMAVALDYLGQLGRFSTDMAALGIPCVGTNTIGRHEQLHPHLTVPVGPRMIPAALDLVRMLNEDEAFYSHCSSVAFQNVEAIYGVDACRARWKTFQERLWS